MLGRMGLWADVCPNVDMVDIWADVCPASYSVQLYPKTRDCRVVIHEVYLLSV